MCACVVLAMAHNGHAWTHVLACSGGVHPCSRNVWAPACVQTLRLSIYFQACCELPVAAWRRSSQRAHTHAHTTSALGSWCQDCKASQECTANHGPGACVFCVCGPVHTHTHTYTAGPRFVHEAGRLWGCVGYQPRRLIQSACGREGVSAPGCRLSVRCFSVHAWHPLGSVATH